MFATLVEKLNRRWRDPALPLFAVSTSTLLLIQQGAIFGDGLSVYETTRSLVHDADLSVPRGYGPQGPDGEHYSKYGIGLSLISLVPYLLALPVAHIFGHGDLIEQAAVASVMPIASGLLVVALYQLARRLGATPRSAVLVALGVTLGTFVLPYTKEFFGEPVAALFLVIAIERALAGRPGWSATALAAAVLIRPPVAVLAPILLAVLIKQRGWSTLRYAVPPLAVSAGVTLALNVVKFGSPTATGYTGFDLSEPGEENASGAASPPSETFSTPVLEGLETLLVDSKKSIFLFAPVVVLVPLALIALWRRGRRAAVVLLAGNLLAGSLLVAAWAFPDGGFCWGPRLLIPAVVPALAALAVWLEQGRSSAWLLAAVLALGLAVSAPAVVVSSTAQWIDVPRSTSPTVGRQYELVVPASDYSVEHVGDRGRNDYRRYLSFWQIGLLRELGWAGLLIAVPLSAMLALAAALSARALRRSLAHAEDSSGSANESRERARLHGEFARLH